MQGVRSATSWDQTSQQLVSSVTVKTSMSFGAQILTRERATLQPLQFVPSVQEPRFGVVLRQLKSQSHVNCALKRL